MFSDSITSASIPSAHNARDLGKKKRANRSAKLKQCKLDARREQWLSQGSAKNKGCKEEQNASVQFRKGDERSLGNLELNSRAEEMDGSIHHFSDLDSPSHSPTSATSSVLGGADSGTNFTGSSSSGSSSSSSSSSGGCCSGCITEDDEGGGEDDGCLDDWEAMADALAADEEDKRQSEKLGSELPPERQSVVSPREGTDRMNLGGGSLKPECPKMGPAACGKSRAWRPDDAFRPQSLPNLSKQQSLLNPDRHYGGGITWRCRSVATAPSSCPICYEDLDFTDSSFLPCLCGFHLCLFCHKRILEEDGRCPGCRKPYETPVEAEASLHEDSLALRLARSCSMITRS